MGHHDKGGVAVVLDLYKLLLQQNLGHGIKQLEGLVKKQDLWLVTVRDLFGASPKNTCMSSTKPMTGHLLGAAGAIEYVITVKAVQEGVCPPTINLDNPDPEVGDFNLVPHMAQKHDFEYALTNSFGFGGANGSLVVKKFS